MFNLGKKLGFAALLALSATSANAIVLDTFDYGQDNFIKSLDAADDVANGDVPVVFETWQINDINAAFGDVIYSLSSTASSAATLGFDSQTLTTVSTGQLAFSNDVGISGILSLQYGEFNGTPGASAIDFTTLGNYFYYDVFSIDSSFTVQIDVYDTTSGVGSFSGTSTAYDAASNGGLAERNYIAFNQFSGNADFTSIGQVVLTISGAAASDLAIGEFGVIPEPATLAIFGLGLIGFAASRKRKA